MSLFPPRHRHRPPASLALLSTWLLLAVGCVTTPGPVQPTASVTTTSPATPSAPAVAPVPIVPVVEAKSATITGSEESSTMFDNFTAYVVAVDGQTVPAGREGWKTPLTLAAGPHRLTVEFIRGVFYARAGLQLDALPEVAYQLKFATDAEIFGRNSFCEFWIVDAATGQRVTTPLRMPLAKIARPE